jgi:nucleoid DNA-binding protein
MKKPDWIHEQARRTGIDPETAADQVDRVVNRLLRALRGGQPARLPGLGTIEPAKPAPGKPAAGQPWVFRQEPHER